MPPANQPNKSVNKPSRRQFVKTASVAAAAGAAAMSTELPIAHGFHHSVDDTLKVGLIGCGGRGRGAVVNATHADKNIKITALADAFKDKVDDSTCCISDEHAASICLSHDSILS